MNDNYSKWEEIISEKGLSSLAAEYRDMDIRDEAAKELYSFLKEKYHSAPIYIVCSPNTNSPLVCAGNGYWYAMAYSDKSLCIKTVAELSASNYAVDVRLVEAAGHKAILEMLSECGVSEICFDDLFWEKMDKFLPNSHVLENRFEFYTDTSITNPAMTGALLNLMQHPSPSKEEVNGLYRIMRNRYYCIPVQTSLNEDGEESISFAAFAGPDLERFVPAFTSSYFYDKWKDRLPGYVPAIFSADALLQCMRAYDIPRFILNPDQCGKVIDQAFMEVLFSYSPENLDKPTRNKDILFKERTEAGEESNTEKDLCPDNLKYLFE